MRSEAFLPMGKELHSWNFQNVQSVGGGFLTVEDRLRFFVGARSGDCVGAKTCSDKLGGAWDGNGTTGTATMRRDGFASKTAAVEGVLTTELLSFSGRAHLFLNLNASAASASAKVELLDASGAVTQTSAVLKGVDSTRLAAPWAGAATAASEGAGTGRLRFTLRGGAHLYSFWFAADAKCGASGGPVAAGGKGFATARDTHGACA